MIDFTTSVEAAETALRDLFPPTPLQRNAFLSARYGADIWLKREDLTPVRSYKIRGAINAMRKKVVAGRDLHVVCASAGNHAQGVAYACRHFGAKGTIFMPVTTPGQKIDKTRSFGGDAIDIRFVGDYFEQTLAAAQEFCQSKDAEFIPPFDDADVIAGQATVASEFRAQLSHPADIVVLPVGGGGLSAGVTAYLSETMPDAKFAFVEPKGAPSLKKSLEAGELVTLPKVDNFVDGANVGRIGQRNFAQLRQFSPSDVITPSEDRLCMTILEMLNTEGIVLEPAGALTIDALQDLGDIRGKSVLCVVSGGNFDFERLPEVKERAQRFAGLKKYYVLRMPQRPGALREVLELMGPTDDIARFEYLKKSARNFGTVLIGIETDNPANLTQIEARLDSLGYDYRDITGDETLAELLI